MGPGDPIEEPCLARRLEDGSVGKEQERSHTAARRISSCWIDLHLPPPAGSRKALATPGLASACFPDRLPPQHAHRPARPYALPGQVSQSPSDISDPSFSSPSRDGEELFCPPRLISTVTFLYGRTPARYPICQDLLRSYGGAVKAPIRGGGFHGWREPSGRIE